MNPLIVGGLVIGGGFIAFRVLVASGINALDAFESRKMLRKSREERDTGAEMKKLLTPELIMERLPDPIKAHPNMPELFVHLFTQNVDFTPYTSDTIGHHYTAQERFNSHLRYLDEVAALVSRFLPPYYMQLGDGYLHRVDYHSLEGLRDAWQWNGPNGLNKLEAILQHFPWVTTTSSFKIDGEVRFEHEWVIAPSGSGKTTLLQTQIVEDLERVARGKCSIIVIDSQNQLIPKIARLNLFAPGEPLEGKLVVIEPDPEYPPALNALDIGLADLSLRDRYRMQAEALENVKSCMATMADTQDDMLSYLVELCFAIPGATIQTIVDLLKPNGLDGYRKYLEDVDQTCRDYFETTFSPKSQATNVTKEALTRRLMGMLRNPTFRRMFLNERNKFRMADELKEPKVILINTDLEFLRHDACQLFGRFFIAQLLQAAEMRGANSLPVYCYIDECQDYIANDDKAAQLMDKARKRKVGMIFAHQRLANIESANVRDALSNVAIRFAGGNETDAQYLSRILRCDPEFIANKTRGTFACYVRRKTSQAVEAQVPPNVLERLPTMTEEEYEQIRDEMRQRYTAPPQTSRPRPTPEPEPPAPKRSRKKIDADAGPRTKPEGDWEP